MPPAGETPRSPESPPPVPSANSNELTEDELRKLAELIYKLFLEDVRIERERLGRW